MTSPDEVNIYDYMRIAAAAGISYSDFWKMSAGEVILYAEAYAEQQRQIAYLQAMTIRAMIMSGLNGKRAPSYEAVFGDPNSENDQMDDDALFRAVMTANQALGGENNLTGKGVT